VSVVKIFKVVVVIVKAAIRSAIDLDCFIHHEGEGHLF